MKNIATYCFFILCSLACLNSATAQDIQFNEDPDVTRLFETWVSHNRSNPYVAGWRVQLISTTDRSKVEEGKTRFMTQFPDIPADWVHEKPYYKLRVGAFHSRQEALALIDELKAFYPGAYTTQDNHIHVRDFLTETKY